MNGRLSAQIRSLVNLRTSELKEKYIEVYGEEPSTNNRENLLKRVAWRMQANAEGGLTERARLRADALASAITAAVSTARSTGLDANSTSLPRALPKRSAAFRP